MAEHKKTLVKSSNALTRFDPKARKELVVRALNALTEVKDMRLEKFPEKLDGLYLLYKGSVKFSQERGFSSEAAFWIAFAEICPCIVWNEDATTEVKLSEVLRLYLSIYYEQVNPQMTVEEEPQFLELLKERYDKVNLIFLFESHPKKPGLAA